MTTPSRKRKREDDKTLLVTFVCSELVFDRSLTGRESSLGVLATLARQKGRFPLDSALQFIHLRDNDRLVLEDDDDFIAFMTSTRYYGHSRVQVTTLDEQNPPVRQQLEAMPLNQKTKRQKKVPSKPMALEHVAPEASPVSLLKSVVATEESSDTTRLGGKKNAGKNSERLSSTAENGDPATVPIPGQGTVPKPKSSHQVSFAPTTPEPGPGASAAVVVTPPPSSGTPAYIIDPPPVSGAVLPFKRKNTGESDPTAHSTSTVQDKKAARRPNKKQKLHGTTPAGVDLSVGAPTVGAAPPPTDTVPLPLDTGATPNPKKPRAKARKKVAEVAQLDALQAAVVPTAATDLHTGPHEGEASAVAAAPPTTSVSIPQPSKAEEKKTKRKARQKPVKPSPPSLDPEQGSEVTEVDPAPLSTSEQVQPTSVLEHPKSISEHPPLPAEPAAPSKRPQRRASRQKLVPVPSPLATSQEEAPATLCPYCETYDNHPFYRCPVFLGGPDRLNARIDQLQNEKQSALTGENGPWTTTKEEVLRKLESVFGISVEANLPRQRQRKPSAAATDATAARKPKPDAAGAPKRQRRKSGTSLVPVPGSSESTTVNSEDGVAGSGHNAQITHNPEANNLDEVPPLAKDGHEKAKRQRKAKSTLVTTPHTHDAEPNTAGDASGSVSHKNPQKGELPQPLVEIHPTTIGTLETSTSVSSAFTPSIPHPRAARQPSIRTPSIRLPRGSVVSEVTVEDKDDDTSSEDDEDEDEDEDEESESDTEKLKNQLPSEFTGIEGFDLDSMDPSELLRAPSGSFVDIKSQLLDPEQDSGDEDQDLGDQDIDEPADQAEDDLVMLNEESDAGASNRRRKTVIEGRANMVRGRISQGQTSSSSSESSPSDDEPMEKDEMGEGDDDTHATHFAATPKHSQGISDPSQKSQPRKEPLSLSVLHTPSGTTAARDPPSSRTSFSWLNGRGDTPNSFIEGDDGVDAAMELDNLIEKQSATEVERGSHQNQAIATNGDVNHVADLSDEDSTPSPRGQHQDTKKPIVSSSSDPIAESSPEPPQPLRTQSQSSPIESFSPTSLKASAKPAANVPVTNSEKALRSATPTAVNDSENPQSPKAVGSQHSTRQTKLSQKAVNGNSAKAVKKPARPTRTKLIDPPNEDAPISSQRSVRTVTAGSRKEALPRQESARATSIDPFDEADDTLTQVDAPPDLRLPHLDLLAIGKSATARAFQAPGKTILAVSSSQLDQLESSEAESGVRANERGSEASQQNIEEEEEIAAQLTQSHSRAPSNATSKTRQPTNRGANKLQLLLSKPATTTKRGHTNSSQQSIQSNKSKVITPKASQARTPASKFQTSQSSTYTPSLRELAQRGVRGLDSLYSSSQARDTPKALINNSDDDDDDSSDSSDAAHDNQDAIPASRKAGATNTKPNRRRNLSEF